MVILNIKIDYNEVIFVKIDKFEQLDYWMYDIDFA